MALEISSPSREDSIILRDPPLPPPKETRYHRINIAPNSSPASFPYPQPAHIWLSRDVSHRDWAKFVGKLLADDGSNHSNHKEMHPGDEVDHNLNQGPAPEAMNNEEVSQRIHKVLAEWNDRFFKPRGLLVIAGAGGSNLDPSSARKRSAGCDKSEKWWKLGEAGKWKGLLGLDFGGSKPGKQSRPGRRMNEAS